MIVADSNYAMSLREKADVLYNLADKTVVPQIVWTPSDSFTAQSATVTTVKFLREISTSQHIGIQHIDTQSALWQLNWALNQRKCDDFYIKKYHSCADSTRR